MGVRLTGVALLDMTSSSGERPSRPFCLRDAINCLLMNFHMMNDKYSTVRNCQCRTIATGSFGANARTLDVFQVL